MDNPSTTLVLGIGNTLLTDEGIGIHVINYLVAGHSHRSDATFLDGGTLSFTLADAVAAHARLIVVDAAYTGSQPGTVSCFEGAAMDRYLKGNRQSVHEVGLTDLLDIARLSDCYPSSQALVGIEPHSMEWGEQPSALVAEAIPKAAAEILRLIDRWAETRG